MAVKSCNTINIFHRDIKAANILINIEGQKKEIITFLSDFGEAILLNQGVETLNSSIANKPKKLTGTPMYLAPELRKQLEDPNKNYDEQGYIIANYDPRKSDSYSLGCVIL